MLTIFSDARLVTRIGYLIHVLTLFWLGGGGKFAPLVDFFNNSAGKIFIAMKLPDFLQLLIVQLLKKFH